MRKYLSFFRLRFTLGLQYRAAAVAGMVTQFVWGAMEILVFKAFYETDASAFPMSLQATTSYIWLQQAFLALFMAWLMENEIFNAISNGNIAYELCRPVDIYGMWFSRSLANRLSKASLRCIPILLVAVFLPNPYGLMIPHNPITLLLFLFTLILGLFVTVAFGMIVYVLTFFTMSPTGIKIVFVSMVEFFAGAVIPLPFFPDNIRKWMELLPFAAMQNVPFRIYSQDIKGSEILLNIILQVFWLLILVMIGRIINTIALKRVAVQGG